MSLYGRLPTAFNRKLAKSRGGNELCLLSVASLEGKRKMKNANKAWPMLPALVLLTACSMGDMRAGTGTHLSAVECRDLTEIKHKAPAYLRLEAGVRITADHVRAGIENRRLKSKVW